MIRFPKFGLLLVIYLFVIFIAFGLSNLIVFDKFWIDGKSRPSLLIATSIAGILSFLFTKQNSINPTTQIPQLLERIFEFISFFSFTVLIYWFSVGSPNYKKEGIIIFILLTFIGLLGSSKLYINSLRRFTNQSQALNVLIFGTSIFSKEFESEIAKNEWLGLKVISNECCMNLEDSKIIDKIKTSKISKIFINWDEYSKTKVSESNLRHLAEHYLVECYAFSEVYNNKLIPSAYYLAGSYPYIKIFSYPLDSRLPSLLKRSFDFLFSLSFLLLVGIWLFPLIALVILLDSGFPVFFAQKRHGMDHKVFRCYKFRTMVNNKQSDSTITIKNDPRITRIGRILRKTSIDELPQFWNILKGDMSVVGPRPHMVNQNIRYHELIEKYNFRHYIKPGLTGLAQINGHRGEIKKQKDMEDRVQSDIYYIRNWSFGLDIQIIIRTFIKMIKGDDNAI